MLRPRKNEFHLKFYRAHVGNKVTVLTRESDRFGYPSLRKPSAIWESQFIELRQSKTHSKR
jgi:hypothetical protein